METYFAYDIETANYDYSTICQIGLVKFEEGQVVESWDFLINPQTEDFMFTGIHGITYDMVENKPTFNVNRYKCQIKIILYFCTIHQIKV